MSWLNCYLKTTKFESKSEDWSRGLYLFEIIIKTVNWIKRLKFYQTTTRTESICVDLKHMLKKNIIKEIRVAIGQNMLAAKLNFISFEENFWKGERENKVFFSCSYNTSYVWSKEILSISLKRWKKKL